jgi:hypothetical protein
MSGTKTGVASAKAWYNIAPNSHVPFLGMPASKRATVSNSTWQEFLTAANKRLVKNWMGILKHMIGDTPEKVALLNEWFGTEEGRRHFRGWAQQLGTQGGDRKSATSAHGAGKAMDINYDYNPWCPVCKNERPAAGETFRMVGEKIPAPKNPGDKDSKKEMENDENLTFQQILDRCGRAYDRTLRMHVPLKTEANDDRGFKHFARTYYRNHHDWTLSDSTDGNWPLSPDQVYRSYQILNWSIRFYFHYLYGQIAIYRKEYKSPNNPDELLPEPNDNANCYNIHTGVPGKAANGAALWARIKADIDNGNLPPTAEILIDKDNLEKNLPDDKRSGIVTQLTVRYPFESSDRIVYRLSFEKTAADLITEELAGPVGKAILDQIEDDHHALSLGMLYTYPGRRAPCNGVFNFSYETVLALCYLLEDPLRVRAFGCFSPNAGGDMQHFDYDHADRT